MPCRRVCRLGSGRLGSERLPLSKRSWWRNEAVIWSAWIKPMHLVMKDGTSDPRPKLLNRGKIARYGTVFITIALALMLGLFQPPPVAAQQGQPGATTNPLLGGTNPDGSPLPTAPLSRLFT